MTKRTADIEDIVEFLDELFAARGAEAYMGESVSMSEHMLQTAHKAQKSGASDELTAASLLHDVGHFVGDFPVDALEKGTNNYHEQAAASLLSHWFPPDVTEPIRLHVAAKRYLCSVEPEYFQRLSPASVHTLELQGGRMAQDEILAFEANPHATAAVALRRWDDAGKISGHKTPNFTHYHQVLRKLVRH